VSPRKGSKAEEKHMANSASPNCKCQQEQREAMQQGQPLGLDEDGTLYQVQGVGADGLGEAEAHELGRYFLGEDGTLYELSR
jgi:hypothetical protein